MKSYKARYNGKKINCSSTEELKTTRNPEECKAFNHDTIVMGGLDDSNA